MVFWLIRRLLGGLAVVAGTIVACAAIVGVMIPKQSPKPGAWAGTVEGVRRMLLHLDFGPSQIYPGALPVTELFARGWALDLVLLGGALIAGTALGIAGARFCAARPRSWAARGMESFATLALSAPVYSVALGLLLLFEPTFGTLAHVPGLFEPGRYTVEGATLLDRLEGLLVPWVLVGSPVAAVVLRLTAAETIGQLEAPYVRTAQAVGLRPRRVIGHAARPTYATTAGFLGTQVRVMVLNAMLVEHIFYLPGFLLWTKRAIGDNPPLWTIPDPNTLSGIAAWSALLVVVLSLLSDIAVAALDPRVSLRHQ